MAIRRAVNIPHAGMPAAILLAGGRTLTGKQGQVCRQLLERYSPESEVDPVKWPVAEESSGSPPALD